MKTIATITTLILLFMSTNLFAQDKIVKTNRDTIYCKVKEILSDEIKYMKLDVSSDVLFGIDKNKVSQVIFENGKILNFEHSMLGAGNYEHQKKHALKAEFLAPITGNTTLSYERLIKPTKSWEVSLGIIGLGMDNNNDNGSGAFLKFGLKYIKSPDFYLKGMRYAHILKGTYFKPEISVAYFTYEDDFNGIYSGNHGSENKTSLVAALNLNVGKQWVINDAFLIDWYLGMGYGIGKENEDSAYHYGFMGPGDESPLTFNAGFKVGILLK